MPAILRQVESIIQNGIILDSNENPDDDTHDSISINFNVYQLEEEKEKSAWLTSNPQWESALTQVEDHKLLYGQVGIIGLDKPELFDRFIDLFDNCTYGNIDCALMAISPYIQQERNRWRYQTGSSEYESAWRNLFHKSGSMFFENTRNCLCDLLSTAEHFSDEYLISIKDEYIAKCHECSRYDWRYYYVKYDAFRPGRYGKFWWQNYENEPYVLIALWTPNQSSINAYQPFAKQLELSSERINRNEYGTFVMDGTKKIKCDNSAYRIREIDSDEDLEVIEINQDENGIDTEDRIAKFINDVLGF